ncbi:hypothetical protein A3F03_01715 [Candidatus Roizmanbacteria bacterium RIFCSPHIGHO2_12_FULL_41_11]|uniref:PpiC domain-containing protein n=1 Tax=Candidatus Roizmanbacteria bacterium RIFCSPHIGHO2_12_FULL_41_11 TaxID=1802052 RepID=A0A1F7I088_9BACT|nr:MAG: hypothetical protein A3F03_01715 [Candidatus Roizmanbacteria bacterium RIFCSPHIGHO2_12_FULL_41_11]
MPNPINNQPASPANSSPPSSTPPAPLPNAPATIVNKSTFTAQPAGSEGQRRIIVLLQKPIFRISLLVIVIIGISILIFKPYSSKNLPSTVSEKPKPMVPAVVNGEQIPKKAYEARLASQEYYYGDLYVKRSGKKPPQELVNDLPRATLENFIQETLLTQYLGKKNITVSDQEAQDFIQKEIIDQSWKGDRQRYEKDLRETFHTDITIIMRSVRRDLLIQKVMEVEKLDAFGFSAWYAQLRRNADVIIY